MIADRHLRMARVIQRSQAETKLSFSETFTKMAVHDGIRSRDDPASVALRVVASDETKSALLSKIRTQRNAIRIRHYRRHHRCRHRYVN